MAGTTVITIQIATTIDGTSRTAPAKTATITHAASGLAMGVMPTSDTAAVIPQGGITPKFAVFENLSAVAGEYIDIMNDTAVLARIDPGMQAAFDISQVATPASNLKAKAFTAKTPKLSYFIVPA
jgi:hypothetical protein